jgi:dTDP-4-dehydrorhamnose reductase
VDLTAPGTWPGLPKVDAAVLCAGNTSIGACADNPAATAAVNVAGLSALADRLAGQADMVLLLSSNQVFDGAVARRGRADGSCPVCHYGRQKAAAEAHVLGLRGGAVLRLTKVLTPDVPLLTDWSADLAAGRPVTPFENFPLAPVTLGFAVDTIVDILSGGEPGVYQASGADDLSYVDLARGLAAYMGADPGLVVPVQAVPAELGFERLPRYSTLEMEVEEARFGRAAPASDSVLEEVVRSISLPGLAAAQG